jgi:hypothetical protein
VASILHRADAFDHGRERNPGFIGDHMERLALEAGYEIFGNGEDLRVGWVGNGGRDVGGHVGHILSHGRRLSSTNPESRVIPLVARSNAR